MAKTISQRFFEVNRGERRAPLKFSVHELDDGSTAVSSIHPYDETKYHWASKSAGQAHWRIIRDRRVVSSVGSFIGGAAADAPLTPEQVAYFLIKADEDAHLSRTGGIW